MNKIMQRRFFLSRTTKGATVAAASPLFGLAAALQDESKSGLEHPLIDTHVSLDRWPFARLPHDQSTENLATHLRESGVVQAWAGSFDALLHQNLDAVNDRLAAVAKDDSLFLPMGAVNPKSRFWKKTLDRCVKIHRMRGLRLHPDFHGYALDDADFLALLKAANRAGMLVQIAATSAEKTTVRTTPIELDRLLPNLESDWRIQLVGMADQLRSSKRAKALAEKGVHVETAAGDESWLEKFGPEQVHFGSDSPRKKFPAAENLSAAMASHNAENLMLQA